MTWCEQSDRTTKVLQQIAKPDKRPYTHPRRAGLGVRYHLHKTGGGLCLPGAGNRPVFKEDHGYRLDNNMKLGMLKETLKMAHKNLRHGHTNIIHHSDRGIQYCFPDYSEFAESQGMILSTTEKYDPYENAMTERINGILKYEFGLVKLFQQLKQHIKC